MQSPSQSAGEEEEDNVEYIRTGITRGHRGHKGHGGQEGKSPNIVVGPAISRPEVDDSSRISGDLSSPSLSSSSSSSSSIPSPRSSIDHNRSTITPMDVDRKTSPVSVVQRNIYIYF